MGKQANTKKIRMLMKMANVSERELAALIDISRSSVNSKLNNYLGTRFTEAEVRKIADVFIVNFEYLYNDTI